MDVGLESIDNGFLALPNRVRCKQNLLLLGLKEDCIWKGILEVSGLDNKECRMGGSRWSWLKKQLSVDETFDFEDDAFVNNTGLRYNPWTKTILGINI